MEKDKRRINFEPYSEIDDRRNVSIIDNLKQILNINEYEDFEDIVFRDNGNNENLIQIATYKNKRIEEFENNTAVDVPKDFNFPVYIFDAFTYSDDRKPRYTTPYGMMPSEVIGRDNHIYSISNAFIFNNNGEAIKQESIRKADLLDATNSKALTLNFLLRKDHLSRYVQLCDRDYMLINGGLRLIKNGTYSCCKSSRQ